MAIVCLYLVSMCVLSGLCFLLPYHLSLRFVSLCVLAYYHFSSYPFFALKKFLGQITLKEHVLSPPTCPYRDHLCIRYADCTIEYTLKPTNQQINKQTTKKVKHPPPKPKTHTNKNPNPQKTTATCLSGI